MAFGNKHWVSDGIFHNWVYNWSLLALLWEVLYKKGKKKCLAAGSVGAFIGFLLSTLWVYGLFVFLIVIVCF
jgi:hypothetical protein